MLFIDLFLLAIGESMDACAVSMAKGTTIRKPMLKHYMSVGLWFGGFQALMTLIGYFIGSKFSHIVESFDHWISFALLSYIGISMIREGLSKDEEKVDGSFAARNMLIMAIATSIDALAAGVSLGFVQVNVWFAAALIGVVTFLFSVAGLKIGNLFRNKYKTMAEITGGVVLIFIGAKILVSHLWM